MVSPLIEFAVFYKQWILLIDTHKWELFKIITRFKNQNPEI